MTNSRNRAYKSSEENTFNSINKILVNKNPLQTINSLLVSDSFVENSFLESKFLPAKKIPLKG